MTESKKWIIRELTLDEYPGTQLRYEVRDETGEVVSLHFWEEDAKQMAAVPQLHSTLREAYSYIIELSRQFSDALVYIEEVARDYGVVPKEDVLERITATLDDDVLNRIIAGLKAAKGE